MLFTCERLLAKELKVSVDAQVLSRLSSLSSTQSSTADTGDSAFALAGSALLNLSKLAVPHDSFSRDLGACFFMVSGGEALCGELKAVQDAVSYQDYVLDGAELPFSVNHQIHIDLLRTSASSFTQASYRDFLGHCEKEATTESVRRILVAFAKRNARVGYVQGFDYFCFLLLALMPEEHVFWTLCAVVISPTSNSPRSPTAYLGY
jgi:hypothetical protein